MATKEALQAFKTVFGVPVQSGPMSSAQGPQMSVATKPAVPAAPAVQPKPGVLTRAASAIKRTDTAAKAALAIFSPEKARKVEEIQATSNPIKRALKTAAFGAETAKDIGTSIVRAPIRFATQAVRNLDASAKDTVRWASPELADALKIRKGGDFQADEYTPQGAFQKFFLGDEALGQSGSLGTKIAQAGSEFALRRLDPTLAALPANDPRRLAAKIGIGAPLALFGGLIEGADAELPGVGQAGKAAAKSAVKKIAKEGGEEAAQKLIKEGAEAAVERGTQAAVRPALKMAAKELPEEIGTFAPSLGKAVHPEDAALMEAFIDNVRLKRPESPQLALAASRIAEGYGMSMPKTENGLANVFDEVLTGMRNQAKFDTAHAASQSRKVPTQAFGAATGVTFERDENGKITGFKFDPKMALVGVAGVSAAQTEGGKKILKQLTDKFGSLAASKVPAEAIEKAAREGSLDAVEQMAKKNSDDIAEAIAKGIDPEELAKPNTLSPIGDALENRRRAILGAAEETPSSLSPSASVEASLQGTPQRTPPGTDIPRPLRPEAASQTPPTETPLQPSQTPNTQGIPANAESSYNARIADNGVFYNIDRLDIPDDAKEKLLQTVNDPATADAVEKITGTRLSNEQVAKLAAESTERLKGVTTVEQTREAIIEALNSRRKVAADFSNGNISGDKLVEEWMKSKSYATDVARQLQALRISAGPRETGIVDEMLARIMKSGADPEEVAKASVGVDFKDYNQVVRWYRSFVKPTGGEMLDKLRYNSMLSSPLTHVVNITSNFQQSSMVAPTYKMVRGATDAIRSALDGKPRQMFAGEGIAHMKGYVKSIGEAAERFKRSILGKTSIENADIRSIPLYTSGPKRVVERTLDAPMRMLEAADQFFTALSEGAANESLAYRAAKGGSAKVDEASREAAYFLFRGKDIGKEQGQLLRTIDGLSSLLNSARNSDIALLRNIAKFSFPFVKTPTEILKQSIEFSPAGLLTLYGAKNKTEQLAKAMTGSLVMGVGGAMLLGSGRMTWGEPIDPDQKAAFRDAGLQPYSVKIGNKWFNYSKLAPPLAFNLAFLAAYEDARKSMTLGDGEIDAIMKTSAKVWKFWADQSFIKGMGDLINATQGDQDKTVQYFANYGNQFIPFRALQGWMTRIFDPVQRKVDPDGSVLEKQLQAIKMQIPGLSQTVPARTNEYGEPIPIQFPVFNALSPVRVTAEDETKARYIRVREEERNAGKDYRKENTTLNSQMKRETEGRVQHFNNLKTREEKETFLRSLSSDELDAFLNLKEDQNKRKDAFADEIRSYGVKNGVRAKAVADRLDEYETREQKQAFLAPLIEDGVLSDEVLDQLADIMIERQKQGATQ